MALTWWRVLLAWIAPRPSTSPIAGLALWCVTAAIFVSCKTGRPQDETVTPDDPTISAPAVDSSVPTEPSSPAQPSILNEPLRPVRGGEKILPPYNGQDPCHMALTGESPVAKACSDGGVRRATEMMQTFVKRAKGVGIVFQCSDCHADEDDFSKLTPQADGEFRKLLFLARPGD